MNRATQDKLWDDLPQEKKDHFILMYADAEQRGIKADGYLNAIVDLFGEHNLNTSVHTWADVENLYESVDDDFCSLENLLVERDVSASLLYKLLATYRISYLIELGYGGRVSKGENEDISKHKFTIVPKHNGEFRVMELSWAIDLTTTFHSREQAEKFLKYEHNLQILRDYFDI